MKPVLKTTLQSLLFLAIALVITAAWYAGPWFLAVDMAPAEPKRGWHVPFFVYVSSEARDKAARGEKVWLLVQPNNTGYPSDDPDDHLGDARTMSFSRHRIAGELGAVLLVPAFNRPMTNWQVYTHALDRDTLTTDDQELARPDLQLIAMMERLRRQLKQEGITLHQKILLQGYSASGMFANRFTVLHPDLVYAVTAGSPGGWPVAPVANSGGESLHWPAGIADVEALTGKPFDLAAYRDVHQLIYMGSLDENDSLDFTDGWDLEAAAQVDRLFGETPLARWPAIQALYKSVTDNADFLLVEGVAHDRKALERHGVDWFRELLEENP